MRISNLAKILAAFCMALITLVAAPRVSTAAPTGGTYESAEVYTTSTTCSNTSALRSAADLLDDGWQSAVAADGYEVGSIGGNVAQSPTANPTAITFATTPITIDVSKYDIATADAPSTATNSWGVVDTSSASDPFLATSATLQDCAPRPASLYDTSAQPVLWNATAGDGSTLDAVMFEFSTPVAAFGAWFGDIESRIDGEGLPAYIKLFDAAGNVIDVNTLTPDRPTPVAGDPSGRTECGGAQSSDALACGNQATKFLGFSYEQPIVAKMLVIVGEDDSCGEFPDNCTGNTEHLSFIGPQLAVFNPSTITLNKVVNNQYEGVASPADFSLSANGVDVAQNQATEVTAGPIIINESQLQGYALDSLECTAADDLVIPVVEAAAGGFELEVPLSADVTCTFTNVDQEPTATTTTATTDTTVPSTTTTIENTTDTTAMTTTTIADTVSTTSSEGTSETSTPTTAGTVNDNQNGPDQLAFTGGNLKIFVITSFGLLLLGSIIRNKRLSDHP